MFDTYARIFARRANSYQAAMTRWPNARINEFISLLEPLGTGFRGLVCDLPAGGGYLAQHLNLERTRYLAVEPTEFFLASCPTGGSCHRVHARIDQVPLADGIADCIVSNAGLHHERDLSAVFREMRRLAKRGCYVVIADAAIDTRPANFLNGYVAENTPHGHDGRFLDANTAALLRAAGLHILEDRLTSVPWTFDTRNDAGLFCRDLFGITGPDPEQVARALEKEVGLSERHGKVELDWNLRRIVCVPALA